MTDHNEETYVEIPIMEQLEGLGWDTLFLDISSAPDDSYRTSFREVVLEPELRFALKNINPWIEEDLIDHVIGELVRLRSSTLQIQKSTAGVPGQIENSAA